MDAIELLTRDHTEAREAMRRIADASVEERMGLFVAFKIGLEMHDRMEEEAFYPAIRANPQTQDFAPLDKEAHHAVEAALATLAALPMDSPQWRPQFDTMRERLLAHIDDEEHRVFVKIRESLSKQDLNGIAQTMSLGMVMKPERPGHQSGLRPRTGSRVFKP